MAAQIKVVSKQTGKTHWLRYAGQPIANMLTENRDAAPYWHPDDVKKLAGWLARSSPQHVISIERDKVHENDVEVRRFRPERERDMDVGGRDLDTDSASGMDF